MTTVRFNPHGWNEEAFTWLAETVGPLDEKQVNDVLGRWYGHGWKIEEHWFETHGHLGLPAWDVYWEIEFEDERLATLFLLTWA